MYQLFLSLLTVTDWHSSVHVCLAMMARTDVHYTVTVIVISGDFMTIIYATLMRVDINYTYYKLVKIAIFF